MHRNCNALEGSTLKTATLASLRVEPDLREAAESVLLKGETLTGFIESSVRETIARRRARAEFMARGLMSRDDAGRTGGSFATGVVYAELKQMLKKAKARVHK